MSSSEVELDDSDGVGHAHCMTDSTRGQLTGSAADIYEQIFVPAIFAQWPPVLLDAAGVAPGHEILDVGCGTGVLATAAMKRVGPNGRVVGLDPNRPMLTIASRRPEPVEWRSAAAEAIPYPDGSFDRVLSQFALMYFANPAKGLAEMGRVTAPGGRVAIATWAAVADSPGYAALVDVVARTVGEEAADGIREPFCLSDPAALGGLIAASFTDVEVHRRHGAARFDSIESMMRAEIRGWTLSDAIDDEQYERMLAVARADLAFLTDATGRVAFAMPALVATGRR
jgi:SAM-dependent methyltransferase